MNLDIRFPSFVVRMFCLILIPHAHLGAQQAVEFTPPFEPGDILVYDVNPSAFPPHPETFILSTGPRGYAFRDKESWFNGWGAYPIANDGGRFYRHRFSVDSSGFVWHEAEWDQNQFQVYPAFIPQGDQLVMNGETWNVPRHLDTTVLGVRTRGFEMERNGLRRIITERFGETSVLDRDGNAMMVLNSAVIRDTTFNRDPTHRNYLPLCVGSRYVYFHDRDGNFQEEVLTEVTETSEMDGRTWYHLEGKGPLIGWFRSDSTGIYEYRNGQSTLHIPGNATLGMRTRIGMIFDTATVAPWPEVGRLFFRVHDRMFDQDYNHYRIWLSGLGILEEFEWGYAGGSETFEYIWGIICGETIGVVVDVERDRPAAEEARIDEVYPNPASAFVTVSFVLPHAMWTGFVVRDLLGRRVRQLGVSEYPAGSHRVRLSVRGLRPGSHFLTLLTPGATLTRRVMVRQ